MVSDFYRGWQLCRYRAHCRNFSSWSAEGTQWADGIHLAQGVVIIRTLTLVCFHYLTPFMVWTNSILEGLSSGLIKPVR